MVKPLKNEMNASVALSYLCLFASVAASLIVTPVIVRNLGAAEYGLYMLAYSVGMYVNVDGLGIGGVIVRQVKEHLTLHEKEELEGFLFVSLLVFAIIAAVAFLALSAIGLCAGALFSGSVSPENIKRFQSMLSVTAVNCALMFLLNHVTSAIMGHDRLLFVKGLTLLKIIARTLFVVLAAGMIRIETLVALDLGITCVLLLLSAIYAAFALGVRLKPRFDGPLLRPLFKRTGFIFVSLVSDNVCWNSGSLIVAMSFGEASAGQFSVAMTLCGVFSQLSSSISGLFLPGMTGLVVGGASSDVILEKMIKTGRYLMALLTLVVVGFALTGVEFLTAYLGEEFVMSYRIALPVMIALLYPSAQLVSDSVIQAMNRFNARSAIQLLSSLTAIALGFWLTPRLGARWSWVGLVVSTVVFRIFVTNIYLNRLGFDMLAYFRRTVPRMVLVLAVVVPALLWCFGAVSAQFIVKCLIIVAVYGLAVWFVYLNRDERLSLTPFSRKRVAQ